MRFRQTPAYLVTFGPAVAWMVWAVRRYGPTVGYGRTLALAGFTALGILGLSTVVVAWLPAVLERLGLRRAAAVLRRYWDPDAR